MSADISTDNVIVVGDWGDVVAVELEGAVEVEGAQIPLPPGVRRLDDLIDVEGATGALTGNVLIKTSDGQWRPGTVTGGGGLATYVFLQNSAAATWAITHPLGRTPQVTVIDTTGTRVWSDVTYPSPNTVTITHAVPLAGTAILT